VLHRSSVSDWAFLYSSHSQNCKASALGSAAESVGEFTPFIHLSRT
jgi:hypothetical protein